MVWICANFEGEYWLRIMILPHVLQMPSLVVSQVLEGASWVSLHPQLRSHWVAQAGLELDLWACAPALSLCLFHLLVYTSPHSQRFIMGKSLPLSSALKVILPIGLPRQWWAYQIAVSALNENTGCLWELALGSLFGRFRRFLKLVLNYLGDCFTTGNCVLLVFWFPITAGLIA